MSTQVNGVTRMKLSTALGPAKARQVYIFLRGWGSSSVRSGGRAVALIPLYKCDDRTGTWGVTGSMLMASVFPRGVRAVMQLTPRASSELSFFQLASLVPLTKSA